MTNDVKQAGLPTAKTQAGEATDSPRVVLTQQLFAGDREICIDHEGERYLLRITRRNKLILQK